MRRHGFDRIFLAVGIAALLTAAAGNPLAGVEVADAAAVRGNVPPTFAAAPGYQLTGFTWPSRASVAVHYTWEGGPCLIDGTDLSGPVSTVSPAVALQAFQSSLEGINSWLRGGLLLVNAGPASRADLCSENTARPIVVGFGNIGPTGASTEAGLALSFGLTSSSTPGLSTYQAARVFLSDSYAFACTGTPTYRDLQHTITHELLHAIGVGHSQDQTAIMAPSSLACQTPYVLQPDDVAALAALYPAPAPSSGTITAGSIPRAGGFGLIVFGGGTSAQLLAASGCPAASSAFWATNAVGSFDVYVPGTAIALVNAAWNARFGGGIPPATPLIGRCQ